jgi:hypothetical protein
LSTMTALVILAAATTPQTQRVVDMK